MKEKSSDIINWLKCILCVGVVYQHSGLAPGELAQVGGAVPAYEATCGLLKYAFLYYTTVPIFFMISGYLFFYGKGREFNTSVYLRKLKSRAFTLLLPFVISNLVVFLPKMALAVAHGGTVDAQTVLSAFWAYEGDDKPANGVTWFLRDLMLVSLLSPFIYHIIRKTHWLLPLVLLACWLTGFWFPSVPGFGVTSFLFFSAGACLSIGGVDVVDRLRLDKLWWAYLLVPVAMYVLYYCDKQDWLHKLASLTAFPLWVLMAAGVRRLSRRATCPGFLLTGTFFVYLFHYSLAHRILWYTALPFGLTDLSITVSYILSGMLTAAVLLAVYAVLRRLAPRVMAVALGGR